MKKKHNFDQLSTYQHNKAELEILKAVAQAWFNHHQNSSNPSTDEIDVRKRNFDFRPSRFRIEAMKKKQQKNKIQGVEKSGSYWNFNQSLWDPYEIVAVSKRLEQGLVLDEAGFSGFRFEDQNKGVRGHVKKKETKRSLRDLIDTVSSRRFNHPFLCSLCPDL